MRNSDLQHVYQIVVPTTMYNEPAPNELVANTKTAVKLALAERFGGYTETLCQGGYKAENGELIEEAVYRIEAAYNEADDDLILKIAERIKLEMNQECVMIRKDNESWFV